MEDGVKLGAEQQPDLIILDIRLPDIDGFEVAKRLKARRKTETIPVIFLTERDGRQDRMQGLELGAVDYLNKPFDVQELRLKVRNALAKRKQNTYTNTITGYPKAHLLRRIIRPQQTPGLGRVTRQATKPASFPRPVRFCRRRRCTARCKPDAAKRHSRNR